jgi:putative FmdB family regulatory protein
MPTYDYQCQDCGEVQEEFHSMSSDPEIKCDKCSSPCQKVILSAPCTIIPQHMQASPTGKSAYYGITDTRTGKGIEKLKEGWNGGDINIHKSKSPKPSKPAK